MNTLSLPYLGHHIRLKTLNELLGDISVYSNLKGYIPKPVDTMDWDAADWQYISDILEQYPDNLNDGLDVKKGIARLLLLHQKNLEQNRERLHGYDRTVRRVIQNFVSNVQDITLWGEFLSHHCAQIIHEYEFLSPYEQRYVLFQLANLALYPYRNGYGWNSELLKVWLHHLDMIDGPSDSDRECHIKCLLIAFLQKILPAEHEAFESIGRVDEGVFDSSVTVEAFDVHTAFLCHLLNIAPDELSLEPHEMVMLEQLKLWGECCDVQTWLNIDAESILECVGNTQIINAEEMTLNL